MFASRWISLPYQSGSIGLRLHLSSGMDTTYRPYVEWTGDNILQVFIGRLSHRQLLQININLLSRPLPSTLPSTLKRKGTSGLKRFSIPQGKADECELLPPSVFSQAVFFRLRSLFTQNQAIMPKGRAAATPPTTPPAMTVAERPTKIQCNQTPPDTRQNPICLHTWLWGSPYPTSSWLQQFYLHGIYGTLLILSTPAA